MNKNVENFNKVKLISVFPFLSVMLFFPSITFGIYSAEIFPWAFIISLLYIKSYNKYFLLLILVLFFSFLFTFSSLNNSFIFFEGVRSLGAYYNSLFAFAFVICLNNLRIFKIIKISKFIFGLLLILGIIQFFGIIQFLDPLFKFIIPSSSASVLLEINRGVNLLSIEPARAGNELIFLYILFRLVFIKRNKIIYDILFACYLLIIIQSAMVILFYSIFVLLYYRLKLLYPALILILILPFIKFDFIGGGRAIDLFNELYLLENYDDIFFTLINTSGHRLISIYSSFLYGLTYPFGGGIGNWMISSVEALKMTGFDLSSLNYFKLFGNNFAVGIRSSGFVSNLILDIGWLGISFFIFYLYKSLKDYWNLNNESRTIILLFLTKIFFIGAVGHPLAWIITVVCLRYIYLNSIKETTFVHE